jgi:hypothetical protein
LSSNDVRVIERRHEREPAFLRESGGNRLPVLGVSIINDNLSAVPARSRDFGGGSISRHDDDGRHGQDPRSERNGLRVVPARERDHAADLLLRGKLEERIVRAAELEGAHTLEILGLEEGLHARAELRGGGPAREYWCVPCYVL